MFHPVQTVLYRQKVLFKESSFRVLRQCFLTKPAVNKHFDAGARRAAMELWRVMLPQRAIMKQLGMSKATLMRVFAFARANPAHPIAKRMKGSGHPTKLTLATLQIMKTKLQKTPTLTAIQLRMRIPELEGISVRTIKRDCKQTLKMPSRMMRKKPLQTGERMRIQRLEFANAYRHWDEDDWKQGMFSVESQEDGGAVEPED